MVERQFSKLVTRVRFSSPAQYAPIAQRIEHLSSKEAMKVRFPLGALELIFDDYFIPDSDIVCISDSCIYF